MDYYRIRIIHPDGVVAVRDKSFSQTIEMLQGCGPLRRKAFWAKEEVLLNDGCSVVFVKEV